MDQQPRLTDLVPRRLVAFALLLAAGLGVVAGLEVLYAWMPRLAALTTDGRVAALDLDGEGSLAVWFSSTTLSLAALVAILVYSVRRHKKDDYHGHYRIWLWAAMCWGLMSIDETSSLHEGFKEMMAQASGTRMFGDGSMWWVVPYFFLLGAVGTRLLLDMRRCRLSSTALGAAAACYAVAVVTQLGWFLADGGARAVMLEEGAEMVGNLMLLSAMGLHARFVILDAQGLLEPKAAGQPEEEPQEEQPVALSALNRTVTVHPPHGTSRPSFSLARQRDSSVAVEHAEASVGRKLTKAERKALRRRLERMRAARAGN